MIKRILYSWSFHMKFIKLAEGSFHMFHMKWPLMQDPQYIVGTYRIASHVGTHNICFYGEISKIFPKLSSNTLLNYSTLEARVDVDGWMDGKEFGLLYYAMLKQVQQKGAKHCLPDKVVIMPRTCRICGDSWNTMKPPSNVKQNFKWPTMLYLKVC